MIEIDGSQGEGGGQILRSSLALSLLTGQGVHLRNIRAGRAKPGLLRQHLVAVTAAATIGHAELEGATLGSREVLFEPTGIFPGNYRWDIGSAGSTTLVLQTILLPLLAATGPSSVTITGGTHNPAAPPFHFLQDVWSPHLRGASAAIQLTLDRWGFFPAGGGRVRAEVSPGELPSVKAEGRGALNSVDAHVASAGVPGATADRCLGALRRRLDLPADRCHRHEAGATGPGMVLWIEARFEGGVEQFTAFPDRREEPGRLVERAVAEFEAWRDADAPVGEHLADQLLLPLALAGGAFRMSTESEHFRTNVAVIERFLPVRFGVRGGRVTVDR